MKIRPSSNVPPTLAPLGNRQKPPASPDSYRPDPFDRERNQAGYLHIAKSMAMGAGLGGVAGAASQLLIPIAGVPTGLATALTASAGLITGAWLGLVVGYVGC